MKRSAFVGIALLIAAAAAYGVWRLSVSVQKPHAETVASPEATSPPATPEAAARPSGAPSASPRPAPSLPPAVTAAVPLTATSAAEIGRCLPAAKQATAGVRTLDEAYAALAKTLGGVAERSELRRIVHIELPNGERRRLRLTPFENADPGAPAGKRTRSMRLQMFSEDAEGLPVLMQIPREDSVNPSPETLKNYVSMGKEIYRENAALVKFKNGASADLQEENGHVRLLQISSTGTSLGCALDEISREADCQCLSAP